MKYKTEKIYLIIMGIVFVIGIILILSSVSIGRNIASDILTKEGGMSTEEYKLIIRSYIESWRICGVVVSLLGGAGTLFSGYILYKSTNKQY